MGDTRTIASFFSGYGGLEMGIRSALGGKCRTIVYVEREIYAVANLASKIEQGLLDAAPIHTDVTSFPYRKFRGFVLFACGGVPCQPHSVAGKRKGGNDERFLFDSFFDGLAEMQPGQIFIENVEGLLTSKMPDGSLCFRHIIERLEKMDYKVEAGLFTAAEVGAPHRRKRVFILAYSRRFGQTLGQVQTAVAVESGSQSGNDAQPEAMANTYQPRSQGRNSGELSECAFKWPARPGSPQHDWEEPRVVERRLDRKFDGDSSWLDTAPEGMDRGRQSQEYLSTRVDRLRLIGNGVCPAQCANAWRILNARMSILQ